MRINNKAKGSILIWTILLGISLATVFFFFAQRLNMNAASQQETMEYLNARNFIESYADYIEALPSNTLIDLRDSSTSPLKNGFHGITGTLTNVVDEVNGVLDTGVTVTYKSLTPVLATDSILIEWDKCSADTETLDISPSSTLPATGGCTGPAPPGQSGNRFEESATTTANSFSLSAPGAPTYYRLTPQGTATLYDNEWHLDLEISLGFRKTLRISRHFFSK